MPPHFWLQIAGPKQASDLVPKIVFLVGSGPANLGTVPRSNFMVETVDKIIKSVNDEELMWVDSVDSWPFRA